MRAPAERSLLVVWLTPVQVCRDSGSLFTLAFGKGMRQAGAAEEALPASVDTPNDAWRIRAPRFPVE
jgi:hypothetical protein